MKEIERVGLLKMDFLGLSTLTLIRDALDEIERTEGVVIDIESIPLDDKKTYRLFCDGQTGGIFQFESSGMRELLRKAKPERLDDLIALNALYRPGPLKSGMVDDYVSRKQGRTTFKYELPELEPILSDTYGVIAYQEQVMRIAQALAGFSLGQADVLRKAMGKKDPKVMARQRDLFMTGAVEKQISERKAAKIFDLIEYFAGYGFNKSHSTAYAFLAYQTAYLKANHGWHFAAALLTIESHNSDKLSQYLAECRDRAVPILPPDLNGSLLQFSVEPGRGVRFGLAAIKGLGEGAIHALLDAREALGGTVPSLPVLCEHVDLRTVNKRVFEALVKSGACDTLTESTGLVDRPVLRARLFASIDGACEHGARTQRDRDLGQVGLFGEVDEGSDDGLGRAAQLPDVAAWSEIEQLQYEKESLGLYFSGHPVDRYAEDLQEFGAQSTVDLVGKPNGQASETAGAAAIPGRAAPQENASVGGIVSQLRPLRTKKGAAMCVCSIEDAYGRVEVVVFPEPFQRFGHLVESGRMVVVTGRVERDEDSARILAAEIQPLESVREGLVRSVAIRVSIPPHNRDTFERLWDLFALHKGDRRVAFDIDLQELEYHLRVTIDVNAQIRVRPSEHLISEVERICGVGSVSLR